jgi:hypothetical protein
MTARYDIFRKATDESFIWIETVEDISEAKKRLITLASTVPGDYRLWDPSRQMFIERDIFGPQN